MKITILETAEFLSYQPLPIYMSRVSAGFPSPAADYIEDGIDLNQYLLKNPSSTFIARAEGMSMVNAGILDGALMIVDRSVTPQHNDIVIAAVNGEMTCKILDQKSSVLLAANLSYPPIPIGEETDCVIQGVVMHVINRLCLHS